MAWDSDDFAGEMDGSVSSGHENADDSDEGGDDYSFTGYDEFGGYDPDYDKTQETAIGRAFGLERSATEIDLNVRGFSSGPWDQSSTQTNNAPEIADGGAALAHDVRDVLGSAISGASYLGPVGLVAGAGYEVGKKVGIIGEVNLPDEVSYAEEKVTEVIGEDTKTGIKTGADYAAWGSVGLAFGGPVGALIGMGLRALVGPDPEEGK